MSTPLINTAQLRLIESQMQAQLGAGVLIARAGAAAATWVTTHWPDRTTRVLIVCGPGNNGGDGFACAIALAAAGYAPTVVALAASTSHDAQQMRAQWCATHSVLTALPPLDDYPLIIDALFGVGVSRALTDIFLQAAQAIGASSAHVLALDCPSGLDVERGTWVGDVAGPRARTTLTFIAAKPGLYTAAATEACGEILIDPLGVDVTARVQPAGALNAPDQFVAVCQPRRRDTHKGTFGTVVVVGGNTGMVGAALLAARAALRLGAGRVIVDAIGVPEMRVDPLQPELMFRALGEVSPVHALVMGCGLGQDERARRTFTQTTSEATTSKAVQVIDADALALMGKPRPFKHGAVLTPHPLEAARLLQCSTSQIQADRVGAALQLAAQTQSVIVLKGAGTVIAAGERYWINPTGGPALATAGTGDVLAGMIGALIAQGYSSIESALAATWLHGAAAQAHGADVGLVAGDIAPLAARALAQLRQSHTPASTQQLAGL